MLRPNNLLFLSVSSVFVWILASGSAASADEKRAASANVQVIAHRGASAYAPENTLASFKAAGRMGADLIELDIRQTKDHQLVVVHDPTLARTTDVEERFPKLKPWRVRDLTLAQIKGLDAGSWFGPGFEDERVPTLTEALRTIKATGAGALVELKSPEQYPGLTDRFVSRVKADPYWAGSAHLTVQSYSWRSVKAVGKALPRIRSAVLGQPDETELFGLLGYADVVHPAKRFATPEYIRSVHQRWLGLYVHVVDDPETMLRMIGAGVDGITTDRPDVLRELLRD